MEHPHNGDVWRWLSNAGGEHEIFFDDFVASALVYNLWQDRHEQNFFRTPKDRLVLIDFYSRKTTEDERFDAAFAGGTLREDMQNHVDVLISKMLLRDSYMDETDLKRVIKETVGRLQTILSDNTFCQRARALVGAVPWGHFDAKRVSNYYSHGLSGLSAGTLVGTALFKMAQRIGVSTSMGSLLFQISRLY